MSFVPSSFLKACIASDTWPPASTVSSYERAAVSSQCQVSPNALIWDWRKSNQRRSGPAVTKEPSAQHLTLFR